MMPRKWIMPGFVAVVFLGMFVIGTVLQGPSKDNDWDKWDAWCRAATPNHEIQYVDPRTGRWTESWLAVGASRLQPAGYVKCDDGTRLSAEDGHPL